MFFTTGGGEAVETAWKLAKQYFKLTGKPGKYKVISRVDRLPRHHRRARWRSPACPAFKAPFEPLTPGGFRVPNTNFYRAPEPFDTDLKAFGRWAAPTGSPRPSSSRAPTPSPRCSSSRCRTPAAASRRRPGYFERVREICDEYDVLLVSDEVICAFGRIGSMFACDDFGYVPDMITCAKGMTSGYSPIGAMIASDRLFEPFNDGKTVFRARLHLRRAPGVGGGRRWPTSTSSSARASTTTSRSTRPAFRATLEKLYDLPIVGDVRGEGFFYGIELVKDKATKETFNDDESRAAAARLPLVGAVRGRAVLPRRRPRRPRRPAGAAADQRPGRVRRDRRRSCAAC